MTDNQFEDNARFEDKRAVDELMADVQDSLENSVRDTWMLQNGLPAADDPEGEGIDPVSDPIQIDRLTRLRFALQTALTGLP